MANGKVMQRFKDDLNERGCEQGRIRQKQIELFEKSVNGIGKRITMATYLLITTLAGLAVNLVYLYFKK